MREPRRAAGVIALLAVAVSATAILANRDEKNSAAAGVAAVEAMFATYGSESPQAALRHLDERQAEKYRDQWSGLTVFNDRLEVVEPCRRQISLGTIKCVMSEQHDLYEAGGLAPVEVTFTYRVNGDGEISYISQSVPDHYRDHYAFTIRFKIWLAETHPEAPLAIRGFPGVYRGPSPIFDAESAAASLEFVDEFVAESADYPPKSP